SGSQQFAQFQQIGQTLIPLGAINPQEFTLRSLKLIQIPDPQKLILPPQPPPPDPKVQTEQIKQQTLQQKAQIDQQKSQTDTQAKLFEIQAKQKLAEIDQKMKE